MYGTVSEICIELLKKHENHERMAVITWIVEDVYEMGAEYNPTAADVANVLQAIGEADCDIMYRYGIGQEFVAGELRQIAAERAPRHIGIPENELRALLPAIRSGLDYIDDESGAAKASLETLQRVLDSPSA
ncbi:TPA: DUF1380 family protein [Klebsiella pneumoniae]|jgi:hypothetical protein|uniref:DUF1380 family protein n=1 Tax=Klebsiella pneumoniae subsp. pneumoniae TaxID=72407 RepID=A0ACC7R5G8_KLEPN|nr:MULTISPECIES: DUF1380 family protein [Klebsiella/Raoultella group]EKJ7348084.1 DUF1380 family protein [Klebsiella pneumoniae]EKW2176519.1 DUF1380 family protein [Klebsiella pneumoniae]EKY1566245.1 DUF1380 family protein [Klebsiella pneumoniae]ELA0541652.1 DUF1380 family protein [Klebsiella pneumoniae]ELA2927654.1 DUF1380 family protein [Klebsiella variicola]